MNRYHTLVEALFGRRLEDLHALLAPLDAAEYRALYKDVKDLIRILRRGCRREFEAKPVETATERLPANSDRPVRSVG